MRLLALTPRIDDAPADVPPEARRLRSRLDLNEQPLFLRLAWITPVEIPSQAFPDSSKLKSSGTECKMAGFEVARAGA